MWLNQGTDVYIMLFCLIIIFLSLAYFAIYFVFTYRKKQIKNVIEKTEMRLQYESELLQTQIEVQEQTMQTIASSLHDNIGQLLSLTSLHLGSINLDEREKAEKKVESSAELVNRSIKELRELAKLLHGEQLLQQGLAYAIEQEVNWLKKAENYQVSFHKNIAVEMSKSTNDVIILRMFQEIINNIIKHAKATEISVAISFAAQKFNLSVSENGVGFNYNEIRNKKGGMGLYSIEKRVQMINGKFSISSNVDRGTAIDIEVPYL